MANIYTLLDYIIELSESENVPDVKILAEGIQDILKNGQTLTELDSDFIPFGQRNTRQHEVRQYGPENNKVVRELIKELVKEHFTDKAPPSIKLNEYRKFWGMCMFHNFLSLMNHGDPRMNPSDLPISQIGPDRLIVFDKARPNKFSMSVRTPYSYGRNRKVTITNDYFGLEAKGDGFEYALKNLRTQCQVTLDNVTIDKKKVRNGSLDYLRNYMEDLNTLKAHVETYLNNL